MRYEQFSVGELTVRAIKAPTEFTGSVTQATSRSTGVTLNAYQGQITTDTTSLAAAAEATFTVTNNKVNANSIIVLSMTTPSSTGFSQPFVSKVQAGSFDITLTNLHASTADTSASVISFLVLNGNP